MGLRDSVGNSKSFGTKALQPGFSQTYSAGAHHPQLSPDNTMNSGSQQLVHDSLKFAKREELTFDELDEQNELNSGYHVGMNQLASQGSAE